MDSPGSVGWNPRSVTFSSSTSEGYSVWMSSSFRIVGIPRDAAVNLEARKLYEIKHTSLSATYLSRVYNVQKTFFLVSQVNAPREKRF